MLKKRSLVLMVAVAAALAAACGGDDTSAGAGRAETNVGSAVETTASSTSTTAPSSSTTEAATTTSTTAPTTTSETATTSTTTTTVVEVAAGLPTPDDVALQYDSLCLQTDSRDLVEKWFEPGVLDELNCRQAAAGEAPQPQGTVTFDSCSPIENAAGDASHRCFFYYEGGAYSILVGDLGRGYRGLAATFVVD